MRDYAGEEIILLLCHEIGHYCCAKNEGSRVMLITDVQGIHVGNKRRPLSPMGTVTCPSSTAPMTFAAGYAAVEILYEEHALHGASDDFERLDMMAGRYGPEDLAPARHSGSIKLARDHLLQLGGRSFLIEALYRTISSAGGLETLMACPHTFFAAEDAKFFARINKKMIDPHYSSSKKVVTCIL